MPAMPTMGMPAMRSESDLIPAEGAEYRGEISLTMKGRWDVTVRAIQMGRLIAELRTSVIVP
jgi:hypothetical protein